jgi:hypothetical protein
LTAWCVQDAATLKHRGRVLWDSKGVAGTASWATDALAVHGPDLREFAAFAPGVKEFRAGDVTLTGTIDGEVLRWRGRRPLRDAFPAGVPVMSEDFSSGVAPYWFVLPLAGVGGSRIVEGEFCCPGLRREWISYTHRNFNRNAWQVSGPPRADIFQWPRCRFGDVVVRGEFTIVECASGATFTIAARVADRTYPEESVDQDRVQVEVDPARRRLVLAKRVDGKVTILATCEAIVEKGKKHAYELAVQGSEVRFVLDGERRIQARDAQLPREGYVQWEVGPGAHIHLDNIRLLIDPVK